MMSTQTKARQMEVVVTHEGVDPARTDVSTEHGVTCTYEPHANSYRVRFDDDSPAASEAVIDVLAAIEATDPVDLPPLFHAVDPDALDSLVTSAEENDDSLCVSFAYAGHEVTVTA